MISLLDIPLAARRPNIEGDWIEILIPILIIVVYAVSGILKMRSNLKGQQKSEEGPERPRYGPLPDESLEWRQPAAEGEEQESARLERLLEVKPMPRTEPAVQPRKMPARPARPPQYTQPQERTTLDAFLATQAPRPLAERIAEARAKAEAQARAQAQPQPPQPLWPRASERQEVARTRKPKEVPAPTVNAAVARPRPAELVAEPLPALGDLTERDTLRQAIIYSEVLGAPVALRDMDTWLP
jgi:hypothetical protein